MATDVTSDGLTSLRPTTQCASQAASLYASAHGTIERKTSRQPIHMNSLEAKLSTSTSTSTSTVWEVRTHGASAPCRNIPWTATKSTATDL